MPFAQNVSFTLSSQNNITSPTFYWNLPSGFTPDVQRIEIWQINGAGVASTGIYNATLQTNQNSFSVPT